MSLGRPKKSLSRLIGDIAGVFLLNYSHDGLLFFLEKMSFSPSLRRFFSFESKTFFRRKKGVKTFFRLKKRGRQLFWMQNRGRKFLLSEMAGWLDRRMDKNRAIEWDSPIIFHLHHLTFYHLTLYLPVSSFDILSFDHKQKLRQL